MRVGFLILIIVLFCSNSAIPQESVPQKAAGDIKLVVIGLKSSRGDVSVALNNTKESYLSRGTIPSFRTARTKVQDSKAEILFKNIPFGEYTVKLYHDKNANGKIDVNLIGIPTEEYAFSNNVRGTFGLPRYEKARFLFDKDGMILEINMKK